MIEYTEFGGCRSAMLQRYFGDVPSSEHCQHCDGCDDRSLRVVRRRAD